MPGWGGGANWYGAGFDPDTDYLFVPSSTRPISVKLDEADPEQSDFRYMRGRSGLRGAAGTAAGQAALLATDRHRPEDGGEFAWQVPLGDGPRQRLIEMGVPDPGPLGGGNFTGPVVTKTLLFLGLGGRPRSGQPPVLNAFDKATGQIVTAIEVPAQPHRDTDDLHGRRQAVHRGRLRRRPHGRSRRPGAALSVVPRTAARPRRNDTVVGAPLVGARPPRSRGPPAPDVTTPL